MAKRTMLPGAFALPGLADERQNSAVRRSSLRKQPDYEKNTVETVESTWKTSSHETKANNGGDDWSSLVDENGEFLPQQVGGRLKHLTKTRPRSPARRPVNHSKRERSSSPDSNSFEYYVGLQHDSELKYIKSKQPTGLVRKSRSSSSKITNKILTRIEDEPQQSRVGHSVKNRYPIDKLVLNLDGSSHVDDSNLDSEMLHQDYYNSDEDFGDMLIADYRDSDESASEDKPPLPGSPPVDVEDLSSNDDESSVSLNPTRTNDNSTTSKLFHSLSTTEDNKNVSMDIHNLLTGQVSLPAAARTSTTTLTGQVSLPAAARTSTTTLTGHHVPTLIGSSALTSQSSARRRRFKPVSIDSVEASVESDQLSQTGSYKSDTYSSMNRTFSGRGSDRQPFDGTSKSTKEIDWGLRAGTLNSRFSDSTLKSGTIFDRFLKRNEKNSERHKVDKLDQQNEVPISKLEDSRLRNKPDHYKQNLVSKERNKLNVQNSNTSLYVIPDIHVEFVDVHLNQSQREAVTSVSKGLQNYDYEKNEHVGNGTQYSDEDDVDTEDDYRSSDNDTDENHDGDDESDIDEDEIYKGNASLDNLDYEIKAVDEHRLNSSTNSVFNDEHHHNSELLNDFSDVDSEDAISNASSTEEQIMMFNNSLGSVTDTHDNTMYSPGEIPVCYHGDDHVLDSSQELYSPPRWDMSDGHDQCEQSHNEEVYVSKEENSIQTKQYYQHHDHKADSYDRNNDYSSIHNEEDAYASNVEELDDVIQPPQLFDEEQDNMEDLFEPPPMFASDDEEVEEPDFEDIPTPLQLSPVQVKKMMPFHKIPLGDWTEDDTLQWLHYVGLGHFKEQFKAHHVNGRTLKNINFQLLEEIGISAPDERELVLAEIYELDNPSEEDHLEAEIQDALETASEQDKEKILAVLTALRSPTLNNSMEFPEHSNESPLDSDQGYHMSSDTASVTSSVAASDNHSRKGSTGITPSQSDHSDLYISDGMAHGQAYGKAVEISNEKPVKSGKGKDHKKTKDQSKKKNKSNKKEKKTSFSKFWESLSISHTSSKLTKVFGSKKLNPAMQYLLQAGPQGIVRIWPTSLSGQTKYCSFMVSMTTTSAQVVRMVLEKYDVVADPLRYYLYEVGLGKGGINQAMEDSDCPLTWQCRWNDPEKYRFEMRCRDEGSVRMLFEIEGFEGDLDYRSILVSSRTPCKDVLPLIVKKYDLPGKVDDYQLMEVSEDNEDDRRVVADHVCPLKLQNAWSEPDHVFRLVRKHVTSPAVPIQPQRAPQIITEKSSEIRNELPRTHSNTSSVKDGYETESIDHPDNTSEEADLPGINKELEEVVMEVQDSISSQQVHQGNVGRTKEHSFALLSHVEEMSRKKDAELAAKETEIEELKKERDELLENESELLVWRMRNKELVERENAIEELKKERDELLENESELLVWRMRNKELVEREEELEELQSSLFEQESQKQLKNEKELVELRSKCLELSEKEHVAKALEQKHVQAAVDELENSMKSKDEELLAREHEIERLYQRNSELLNKEKETQELRDQIKDFTGFQREFENLEKENSKSRAKQKDLETKVHRLEQENDSLRSQSVREDDGVTLIPDTLNVNSAEIKEMRLKLEAVEKDNQELLRTSNDLQRRNQLLEESAKLLDSMREENQSLLAKTKEIEGMKRNIIKLTSQLRQADNLRLNQGELDDLKLRLSICEAEKQQIQARLEELERHNMNLRDDLLETDRLRKENRTLTEKVNELEEVRRSVEINEIKEGDALRQKLLRMQDVEKSMTKELNTKEAILQQKDGKIEEMEKKIRAMTDAMKKMEAKFRDQNEQRENLTRLLTIIKDKDPSLLKTLHRSIITSKGEEIEEEEEDWC